MQIEKGIPIPKLNRYQFDEWPVGGSRFFDSLAGAERCYAAAYSYETSHQIGLRMSRRKEGDGYRVWRVQ